MASAAKFHLGMTLMKSLCGETKENFVFSPLSLGTAFAMLIAGLKGDTKKEVLGLLGYEDEAALHEMYAALISNKDLPIKIANKYLADHRVEVHTAFDKLIRGKYESEVECVNFEKNSAAITDDVNSWVSKKTNKMITKLLEPEILNEDTVLVLLNAVYFKGTWVEEFKPIRYEMEFTKRDGTKVMKKFMQKESYAIKYFETDHLRMVKILYKEAGCYMVVAIPKDEKKHIDEVLVNMSPAEMSTAIESLNSVDGPKVDLTMPKFKIDYKYDNLVGTMRKLGVNKIFQPGVGDFGDLFSKINAGGEVCVSDVVHKAVIEVDEEGTEAAAATAVRMVWLLSMERPTPVTRVRLDRPFLYSILTQNHITAFTGFCFTPNR